MKNKIDKYIKLIGSPKIFVFTVIWLIILVFVGTLVQRNIGLYAAQQQYFSSWFMFIGFIPLPSGKLAMLVMFFNLSCYFFRPHIFSRNKLGITITHTGVIMMLLGSGLTSIFSTEGNVVIDEGEKANSFESYYLKEFVVVNTTNDKEDFFTIFNDKLLKRGNTLNHQSIPFSIEILEYYVNSVPARLVYKSEEEYKGMAKNFFLQKIDSEKEYERNISGIIYRLSGAGEQDGIYINYVGQPITQTLDLNGQNYFLILRRQRTYLPFELELLDFKKVLHPGTNIAKKALLDRRR